MKGAILGVVGVAGFGAVVAGGGAGGPDDFIGIVKRPPSAVYEAFSAIGPAGEKSELVPSKKSGKTAKFTQRVARVPNEQVKFELLIDNEALLTAEVQLSPEGEGTRIAAELDFDDALLRRLMKESGADFEIPEFAFQDFLIDQVFAHAMREMVESIEQGKPLLSVADTHARWRSGSNRPGTFSERSGHSAWEQHQAARPQLDARPTVNPNAERQQVSGY